MALRIRPRSSQRFQLDSFSTLPVELALMINQNLTIKDQLSLADTCRACRPLVSDEECIRACMTAGLSIPPHISVRAMAKLLCRPRVGVSNWSYEGGVPKENLDFSKVRSISSAIREYLPVALHPVFLSMGWMFLSETMSFEKVHLCVAENKPEILLCEHRLYLHEYVTSPPLDKLHIVIKEDEGPLHEGDVTFRIWNPRGVTLGNYYEGLFRFLHQAPDPDMGLTEQVLAKYTACSEPFDPWGKSDHENDEWEIAEDYEHTNPYFDRDCPTNLAMLDIWCEKFQKDIPFSKKGLTCSLPLYTGALTTVIFAEDPGIVRDPDFLAEINWSTKWGEPHREPEVVWFQRVSDEELWKDLTPLIQF